MKRKPLSKTQKHNKYCTLSYLYTFLGAVGIFFSVYIFMAGFHNYDTAQNMRYLEAEMDIELVDQASDFNIYEEKDLYIIGVNQCKYGFMLFGGSVVIFMSGLIPLLALSWKDDKKRPA